MWANSPFSYEAERARIEKIRAERGQRRPSNTQRYEKEQWKTNVYIYNFMNTEHLLSLVISDTPMLLEGN